MKIFLILLVISNSALSRTFGECLDESIETSIALKISAMAQSENGSSCSNIDAEEFTNLGQERENKKRFRDQAVRAFNRTKKFDLSALSDIDEPNPGEADANKTCTYTNLKNNAAIRKLYAEKYPQLKDCPTAVSVFKNSMKSSIAIYAPLYELCHVVQKAEDEMKANLGNCPGNPKVSVDQKPEEIQRAVFSLGGSSGNRGSRATEQ
jgi:hypothetical protein